MKMIFEKRLDGEMCSCCNSYEVYWTLLSEPWNPTIYFCNDCAEFIRKELNI
jgi:hypothetical protein